MKKMHLLFAALCAYGTMLTGQNSRPEVVFQNGVGFHWFENTYGSYTLNGGLRLNNYVEAGLLYALFFDIENLDYFSYYSLNYPSRNGSYDAGFYLKYYLHGKLTGRKSGFFLGTEARSGVLKSVRYDYNRNNGELEQIDVEIKTNKFLFEWGIQWKLGKHVFFELIAPVGFENSRIPYGPDALTGKEVIYFENTFIMQPGVSLGFSF
ncbi:MAG: hypothetical protein JNJ57_15145 [Saprospiraceae bacterium]|nr:hypothetical protein [Saprospiraceae bacterium]